MSMKQAHRAIWGDTKVAAPLSKAAPRASNAVGFPEVIGKIPNLPLNAADRAACKIARAKEEDNHRSPWKRTSTRPLKRGRSRHLNFDFLLARYPKNASSAINK